MSVGKTIGRKAARDKKMTMAELADFMDEMRDEGAPEGTPISATVTIGGWLKSVRAIVEEVPGAEAT